MDDAPVVRLADGLAGLEHVVDGLVDRQGPSRAEDLREIAAREVLHHDVRSAGRQRAYLEHADHVLALDRCRGAGFADEARVGIVVAGFVRREELDGHASAERGVLGAEDDAHASRADHRLDAVLAGHDVAGARDLMAFRPDAVHGYTLT